MKSKTGIPKLAKFDSINLLQTHRNDKQRLAHVDKFKHGSQMGMKNSINAEPASK